MSDQNLIIYKFNSLYHILEELDLDLNFNLVFADNIDTFHNKVKGFKNYLIISNKKYSDIPNQIILDNTPINISKLVEKINIEFLTKQLEKAQENIEKLKDADREIVYKNGNGH
mgnify:CR=1 FL=1